MIKNGLIIMWSAIFLVACASSKKTPTTSKDKPVSATKETTATTAGNENIYLTGKWELESSSDKYYEKANDKTLFLLTLNESDKKVAGSIACNTLNGFFFTSGNQFNFSPLAVTKKKCDNDAIEKYLRNFLKDVGYYKAERNKLYLIHKSNAKDYLVFIKTGK